MQNETDMFQVIGLPNIHIPCPTSDILTSYMDGSTSEPLVDYLREQLTMPHLHGAFTVEVDLDTIRDYIGSNGKPTSTLVIYTGGDSDHG